MLDILSSLDQPVHQILRTETRKTAFLDGSLYALLLTPNEVWFYLLMFASPADSLSPGFFGDIVSAIACSYLIACPVLSLILRQVNYSPLVEAIIPPVNDDKWRRLIPKWRATRMRHTSASGTELKHLHKQ
ncbi:hypothetical protein FGIG_07786 [Fasciola gigantica]|uniref:Uncharacterized protein n=1 Tax=Fasciola gigantica TaxID=46835 RepID=A0A504YQY8_FASGI|nr:hypothetical protein FGIG_07786 [Fasciola gigantica]